MDNTKNLKLIKPGLGDTYDIEKHNMNMDTIDKAVKELQDQTKYIKDEAVKDLQEKTKFIIQQDSNKTKGKLVVKSSGRASSLSLENNNNILSIDVAAAQGSANIVAGAYLDGQGKYKYYSERESSRIKLHDDSIGFLIANRNETSGGKHVMHKNKMIIKSTGEVGINTETPEAKLDVNGDVKADSLNINGNIQIDKKAPIIVKQYKGLIDNTIAEALLKTKKNIRAKILALAKEKDFPVQIAQMEAHMEAEKKAEMDSKGIGIGMAHEIVEAEVRDEINTSDDIEILVTAKGKVKVEAKVESEDLAGLAFGAKKNEVKKSSLEYSIISMQYNIIIKKKTEFDFNEYSAAIIGFETGENFDKANISKMIMKVENKLWILCIGLFQTEDNASLAANINLDTDIMFISKKLVKDNRQI